jgi:hypothetical protein
MLDLSEGFISKLIDEETQFGTPLEQIDKDLLHLDSSHTDLELTEIWNRMYDRYGMRIPQLEERWYRDNGIKDFGEEVEVSEPMGGTVEEFLKSRRSKNELIDLG